MITSVCTIIRVDRVIAPKPHDCIAVIKNLCSVALPRNTPGHSRNYVFAVIPYIRHVKFLCTHGFASFNLLFADVLIVIVALAVT